MTGNLGLPAISVAFQAVADIHTGQCAGYEILARQKRDEDSNAYSTLFADCNDIDKLLALELQVRKQAAEKASSLPSMANRLLFTNLDWRLGIQIGTVLDAGHKLLGPHASQLVTEITAYPPDTVDIQAWINQLRRHRALIALDRFGETARGMAFLQNCDVDFLKIPRSYINGVDRTVRQRVILSQVVATAHTLGLLVIAVGVETASELQVCRELGCDMVQGFFVQRPTFDAKEAGIIFETVEVLARHERRNRAVDNKWIEEQLDETPALDIDTSMKEVFNIVAQNPNRALLPVVDGRGHPLGVVREQTLRNHVYSAFGKELIANRSLGFSLRTFLERCPVASISTPLDRLIGLYSTDDHADGIIITDQNRYRGFLSARSIIRAMHEKSLARARDENPLTKLPGNDQINDYVANTLSSGTPSIMVYLDFDNFKPFNDTYGFRQGDRAILMFAELLRRTTQGGNYFIGHIGGDDFFIGLTRTPLAEAEQIVANLLEKFRSDAESFYDAETRQNGFMRGTDRDGNEREFPLLSISAVLLAVDEDSTTITPDDVSRSLASYKKQAKHAKSRSVVARLQDRKAQFSDLAIS